MSYLIDEYLEHLRSIGRAERTISRRGGVLRRLHADLPLGIAWAETRQLEHWLAELVRAGRTAWTLRAYSEDMHQFYAWADGRVLDGDPAAALKVPRAPRLLPDPVTDDELRLALERSGGWWPVVILFATLAGLRASEVAGLHRRHVLRDRILIDRAKGGDPETVPTHEQLWDLAQGLPDGPLVRDRRGRQVRPGSMSSRAREHFDRIGLPAVHLHRFRHRFATDLLGQGVDMRIVQELMRHQSIQSTQGYTLVFDAQRAAAVTRLPRI